MLKQEFAAYKLATRPRVPRCPGLEQNQIEYWRLQEGLTTWKKAAKFMMAISHFFGSCRASFFINHDASSSQLVRPSKRGSLKTSWRWHWCFSSTEPQQPWAAVKSQSSAVMAAHQLHPVSYPNPFQWACLDADCGWDMIALKLDTYLNHNRHLNKWISPIWKSGSAM